ncbi:MAG: InlB B-repeat-containing protein, partial [Bacteroidales bacterium]|nr:InlB B-repeat-containing protein [Bacteroidales bacterium]
MLSVSSTNPQQGTAIVTQQPDCTNGTAIIEAMPNIGHYFAQWNDGNTDNPRTITVTSGVTYVAEFGISQHNITVVSADMTMGTVSGSGTYGYGTEIQISAIPSDGYRFTAWNDGDTDNPRSITVTQDSTFTANFIALHNITVVSADEEMGTATGTGVYDENSEIQISATPAEHYHFVQWNDGNTDNPRTITVTEDATYTAEFAIDQHTIMVETADTEMGTVSESGTYDYGTEIQISAMANDGFRFIAWNDGDTYNPRTITVTQDSTFTANFIALHTITVLSADEEMGTATGTGVYDENSEIQISATPADHYHFVQWTDGNTDNPRTITVVEDSTFTAEFAIDRFTVAVESADTTMGTVSESGTYDYGAEIEISASASEHYHFVQWSDGNTDNPRTITVVEDTTFTAEFAIDQHTITVESADTEMGTVSEGGTYDYGTEIQISASARDGYQFASWNDDNTDNPRYITVTSDAAYIASFIHAVGIDESIATEIAIFPNPANDI